MKYNMFKTTKDIKIIEDKNKELKLGNGNRYNRY